MYTNIIKTKTLDLQVQDIDAKTRKVVGYFAAFNNIDADGDMLIKGCFSQSIAEKGPESAGNRKIAHLWNHDWSEPIGKLLELVEDDKGLKFVSQMGRSTKGEDAFRNYQDGIIREHSVGFYYLSDGYSIVENKDGNYARITKVDLLEGSSVVFGANSATPVVEVNKSNFKLHIKKLHDEMNAIINVLRNGEGTDERFYLLEMRLKTLEATYNSLLVNEKENPSKGEEVKESPSKLFLLNYLK